MSQIRWNEKAYQRVEQTGKLWPPSSDMLNREEMVGATGAIASEEEAEREFEPRLWTFLLPMIIVILITIWQGDILIGVAAGIVSCLLYIPAGIMSFGKFCDMCYKGIEDMLFIGVVLVTSLFYRESMLLVGLPEFIIEVAGPFMSAALLPAIVFIVVGLICFATGNIWSIPAVTTPIVVPFSSCSRSTFTFDPRCNYICSRLWSTGLLLFRRSLAVSFSL